VQAKANTERAVILTGTGRCGSTLLYRLLSYHPDLAWPNQYSSRFPGQMLWSSLGRIYSVPGSDSLGYRGKRRYLPRPWEDYRSLRRITDGQFTVPRLLEAEEMTPTAAARFAGWSRAHRWATGRERFLFKVTGFPRLDYLAGAFPEASYVHVVRDGRAVASSLLRVPWWKGQDAWDWGPKDPDIEKALHDHAGDDLVMAACIWRQLMRHFAAAIERFDGNIMTVRYDLLVADMPGEVEKVRQFAELRDLPKFQRRVNAHPVLSSDEKWRTLLTPEQVRWITDFCEPELTEWGFRL